ncbi:hypothetical protein [Prolixibacter sp. NT017]|uniref:hypothetical protein n=1 Tax=Prolixibacter sp. NT017 TaxID=2652390 RepID=UPI00127867AA|nr:hypothetical protein [Prolixibacter sp. NT017]GET25481.1 hypothetical protein NT017_18100 [Prolixibacter sp. NT017]
MDNLEKIIKDRRDDFLEEPAEGHFERFQNRLAQAEGKTKRKKLFVSRFSRVAAVAIILLLSANLVMYWFHPAQDQSQAVNQTEEVPGEFNEAQLYYTARINDGISQLQKMANQGVESPKEVKEIQKELTEMDSLYRNLQKELKVNPGDERILNAMIEHYQTKLAIINTILNDLKNASIQKKSSSHENVQI